MNVKQAIAEIISQRKENITYEKFGSALHLTRQRIGQMLNETLSNEQLFKLENYFNVKLTNVKLETVEQKLVNIPYWSEIPEYLRDEDFDCVPVPRKVIVNKWKLNPENLYIVPVVDDGMNEYWYKIFKDDVLIIDTSENYVNSFGVYFATSQNNTRFWIREIDILANETIEFHRYTEEKIIKTYTRQELQEVDFRVIGKVIKNVSFRL